jgi:hypothetical protein
VPADRSEVLSDGTFLIEGGRFHADHFLIDGLVHLSGVGSQVSADVVRINGGELAGSGRIVTTSSVENLAGIHLVFFLILAIQFSPAFHQLFYYTLAENAIAVLFVVSQHVEVDGSIHFIGKAILQELLDDLNLLNDMASGRRFDTGWEDIELPHDGMKSFGVILDDLHGLQLFDPCAFGDLVFAFIRVVFQVTYIGDISNVPDLVAKVTQVTRHYIKHHKRAHVAPVHVIIDRRTTYVHAHMARIDGRKRLLFPAEGVGNR